MVARARGDGEPVSMEGSVSAPSPIQRSILRYCTQRCSDCHCLNLDRHCFPRRSLVSLTFGPLFALRSLQYDNERWEPQIEPTSIRKFALLTVVTLLSSFLQFRISFSVFLLGEPDNRATRVFFLPHLSLRTLIPLRSQFLPIRRRIFLLFYENRIVSSVSSRFVECDNASALVVRMCTPASSFRCTVCHVNKASDCQKFRLFPSPQSVTRQQITDCCETRSKEEILG